MLYTAQFNYKGIDRYDITVKTGNIFCPTWKMVEDFKKTGDQSVYTALYKEKMQGSYKDYPQFWKEMVGMSTRNDITLVCYCKSGVFCHRVLLAEFLQKCGSVYGGER